VDGSPLRRVLKGQLLKNTLIGVVLSSVALIGTWASVQWIPLWVDSMGTGDATHKATAHIVSSIGAVVGSLFAPMLVGRFSRRWGYFTLCACSLVICGYLFRTQSAYTGHFVFTVFLAGTATAAFYGFFPLYLPELFPTAVRATGQGLCYNAGRLIAAVGALTGGQLVAHYGGYAQMGAVITLVYLMGMIAIWFAPETKGKPLPE
jgi:MFS family permease